MIFNVFTEEFLLYFFIQCVFCIVILFLSKKGTFTATPHRDFLVLPKISYYEGTLQL